MNQPFFSIIVPTHGRPELLRRAINCIRDNELDEVEIIVISDETNKETYLVAAETLSEYDTFIKRIGANGPAGSRNIGLEMARGSHVIFLDDDDSFAPGYLDRAQRYCLEHPQKVIYVNYKVIEENRADRNFIEKTSTVSVANEKLEEIYVKNFIHNHTCIFPLHAVKNKKQDVHLASLDDWDFLLNVLAHTEFIHVDIQGPIIYKDYINRGNRRGTTSGATGTMVILDYLHIYRRWPAPSLELKLKRQNLLKSVGLEVPIEWL